MSSTLSLAYDLSEEMNLGNPDNNDAKVFIPYLVDHFDWSFPMDRKEILILDFGCGSGYKTKNILLPLILQYLPTSRQEALRILGYDNNENAIQLAQLHNSDPKISYLTAKEFSKVLPNQFDKIVSFRVLQYVQEPQKLLTTLSEKLKPGGELGLYFPAKVPMFNVIDSLSKEPDWAQYMGGAAATLPKVFHCADAGEHVRGILIDLQFEVQESTINNREIIFLNFEEMIDNFILKIGPITKIPQDKAVKFRDTVKTLFGPLLTNVATEPYPYAVQSPYTLVVTRAKKL